MARRIRWGRYSIEEANATLPLVRAIASDMISLAERISDQRMRLQAMGHDAEGEVGEVSSVQLDSSQNGMSFHDAEVNESRRQLSIDQSRLESLMDELVQLGLKAQWCGGELSVHFPAKSDGFQSGLADPDSEIRYWCWKVTESEVGFWHPYDDCEGRVPFPLSHST